MAIPQWLLVGTIVGFAAVLVLDFVVVERRPHVFSPSEALRWVALYVGAAIGFAALLFSLFGAEIGGQFVAAYLTEYSLSVDNLFVFLVILNAFAVPVIAHHRVLMFGILFALGLRTVMILVGVQAIKLFEPTFIVFGAFLLWTAWKVATEDGDEEPKHIKDQFLVKLASRVFRTTPDYVGGNVSTVIDGKRYLTPIALVMLAIGATDLLFALDSIPAVLGLTTEPFIVLTSNAFALMGLRQLFFLLHGLIDRLVHLARGLGFILAFIGVKLMIMGINETFHTSIPDVDTSLSLAVIVIVLAITAFTSLRAARSEAAAIHDTVKDTE